MRHIPFEAADRMTALGLERNRLGVTLLPRVGNEEEGVSVIDVENADSNLPIALATPSDRPPTAATGALIASTLRASGRMSSNT